MLGLIITLLPALHCVDIRNTKQRVRFGSEADICSAATHVRFAPDSDRESGPPHTVMSALPLKADVCDANRHVCFGSEADICAAISDVPLHPQ
jgi:hypothetical protein